MRVRLLLAASLVVGAGPATAQQTDDWDFGHDPARDVSVAAVTFENFGIAVRCVDGSLGVVMSGLPEGQGERTFRIAMGDEPIAETRWVSGAGSNAAFAVWPRTFAMKLRHGGRLHIEAIENGAVRRYDVDLPASGSAIGQVFQACGKTLPPPGEDAAPDGEAFAGMQWRRRPEIRFPDRATVAAGLAALDCRIDAHGAFRDCRVESEFPAGSGFGRAAVLGTHRTARVEPLVRGQDVEGRRVAFVARYRIDPAAGWMEPPPSRLPNRDEVYNPPRPIEVED